MSGARQVTLTARQRHQRAPVGDELPRDSPSGDRAGADVHERVWLQGRRLPYESLRSGSQLA
jgi:hypothetical protein